MPSSRVCAQPVKVELLMKLTFKVTVKLLWTVILSLWDNLLYHMPCSQSSMGFLGLGCRTCCLQFLLLVQEISSTLKRTTVAGSGTGKHWSEKGNWRAGSWFFLLIGVHLSVSIDVNVDVESIVAMGLMNCKVQVEIPNWGAVVWVVTKYRGC